MCTTATSASLDLYSSPCSLELVEVVSETSVLYLHNSTAEMDSCRKFPWLSVHNGFSVNWTNGDLNACSVHVDCSFLNFILLYSGFWIGQKFDYCQAAVSNLTNPASLTHMRSFLPVFWWLAAKKSSDLWCDNILKQQNLCVKHGADSDPLH